MRGIRLTLAVAVLVLTLAVGGQRAAAQDPAFLVIGAGGYDVNKQDNTAAEFSLQYRSDVDLWIFRPFAGLMATTDSAVNVYAGIGIDLFFGNRWVVRPSFAPGFYAEGDGKDLGHSVEFRSGVEIAYRFDDRARLGLELYHLSNASIGSRNPGEESLILTYAVPISSLFGP